MNGARQKHEADLNAEIVQIIKAYAADFAFSWDNDGRLADGRVLTRHGADIAERLVCKLSRHYGIVRKSKTERTVR